MWNVEEDDVFSFSAVAGAAEGTAGRLQTGHYDGFQILLARAVLLGASYLARLLKSFSV
jgi:hypothetical protein